MKLISEVLISVGVIGCWRETSSPTMYEHFPKQIIIPAGQYSIGCNEYPLCNGNPLRQVEIESFVIDRDIVLESEYQRCFNSSTCRSISRASLWTATSGPDPLEATVIDLAGAEAFCAWRGGRLPSAVEWEIAGRGTTNRRFPWGNTWTKEYLTHGGHRHYADIHQVYPRSGTRPDLRSPFGVEDMSNWREFVRGENELQLRGGVGSSRPGGIKGEDYSLVRVHKSKIEAQATFRCVYARSSVTPVRE